ncbi:MAG: isoaspartyl peptidase/L-asparaginase family protein [Thiohalomonadaceae bacterium]
MYAIVVHGGAGVCGGVHVEPALQGVRRAAAAGRAMLAQGGSALDAVIAAVMVLEDDPAFNAGTGSVLNLDGEAEMDAGVMVSAGLRTGNVAALRRVRNPVAVARAVMEQTDHVLLAGEGALCFARALGFADHDPIIPERRAGWARARKAMQERGDAYLPRLHDLLARHPELPAGTVGAVALDVHGHIAAATSTGGVTLKLPGRIGDTPLPGAGNYATANAGVSATGKGELMMRFVTAAAVCARAADGGIQRAIDGVLADMRDSVGEDAGIIGLDRHGRVGVGHLTPAMPHAWAVEEQPIIARIARRD